MFIRHTEGIPIFVLEISNVTDIYSVDIIVYMNNSPAPSMYSRSHFVKRTKEIKTPNQIGVTPIPIYLL